MPSVPQLVVKGPRHYGVRKNSGRIDQTFRVHQHRAHRRRRHSGSGHWSGSSGAEKERRTHHVLLLLVVVVLKLHPQQRVVLEQGRICPGQPVEVLVGGLVSMF
jgi:hypothetical protein